MEQKLYINIGPGKWKREGWKTLGDHTNYGVYKYECDYTYDLTSKKPIPIDSNIVTLFYTVHVFEHISDGDIEYILKELYRCLKVYGGLRILVPDVETGYSKFKNNEQEWFYIFNKNRRDDIKNFVHMFYDGPLDKIEFIKKYYTMEMEELFEYYTKGLKQDIKNQGNHINWFTYKKLKQMLMDAGFDIIYKIEPNKSYYKEISENKLDNYKYRNRWSLIVEAIKT